MKNEVLEQLLTKLDEACYSIGTYKENAYCMQKKGAGWEVFYGKNGVHLGGRTFTNQEEANKFFYTRIMDSCNKQKVHHGDI